MRVGLFAGIQPLKRAGFLLLQRYAEASYRVVLAEVRFRSLSFAG